MKKLTEGEIKKLNNIDLVDRMDTIIKSSFLADNFEIMKIDVSSIMSTQKVKSLDDRFQRKIAFKVFGMILQIIYTHLAVQPNFNHFPRGSKNINNQFSWAESKQWMVISNRIIAEYFMNILYMIETGEELTGRSKLGKIKKWLKKPENEFVYFGISLARIKKFSRIKRESEIHANTQLAKKILTLSAHEIDNSVFELLNIINNQWQFVLEISNNKIPNGHFIIHDEYDDKDWYEKTLLSDQEEINSKIDALWED